MAGGTLNQPFVFAAMVYAGLLIGAVYSLFSGLGKLFHGKFLIDLLFDTMFILISASIGCFALYYAAGLGLRFFHFLGLAIGIILYLRLLMPCFMELFTNKKKKRIDKKAKKVSN